MKAWTKYVIIPPGFPPYFDTVKDLRRDCINSFVDDMQLKGSDREWRDYKQCGYRCVRVEIKESK